MSVSSRFCSSCGTETTGSSFCPKCGASQGATPSHAAPGGAPPYYGAPPVPASTNGMAIASMVLGILWLYWVGSILALIFGYVAKSQIDSSGGHQSGRGMAIAGIVLGWIGVATLLIVIVVALAAGGSGDLQ